MPKIVEMKIDGVAIYRPIGKFRRAESYCHMRYASERCLSKCVMERRSGLTPGVMIWGAIVYHGRFNFQRIEGIPGAIFQQDNARLYVAKTVRGFCSAQHMQLLPWPDYSLVISSIERVWDLISGVSLVIRVLQLQKTKFFCTLKQ
ncbi:transposable element Tcb2 transposase [Trichonephila clavipes]|nr:transposable element Tcb2 transposase [Trichonephila clavipes]